MRIYKEITDDHGYTKKCYAIDNFAEYQLKSAYAHDLYNEYLQQYNREPSARWYNRHFSFIRIK